MLQGLFTEPWLNFFIVFIIIIIINIIIIRVSFSVFLSPFFFSLNSRF